MASCNITISFDIKQIERLLKLAEENMFLIVQDDFSELEKALNVSNISNNED